jgi:hypothetical protein
MSTTVTTATPSQAQTLVQLFESDLIQAGGQPLLTLLENLKTHAGNVPLQIADWLQFVAAAPTAGLALGLQLENQLLSLAISKLQAHVASNN